MTYEVRERGDSMHECPKCGKRSLNEREGVFHCLWCGFHRNIADSEHSYFGKTLGNFAVFALLVAMVGSILQPDYSPDQLNDAEVRFNSQPEQSQPWEPTTIRELY